MRRFLFWTIILVLLSSAAHIVSAVLMPRMELADTMETLTATGKINSLAVIESKEMRARLFQNAPPDLAIAICPYDIKEKPISISVALPESYWTISIFGPDGQNIYTINDKQVGKNRFSALIMREQTGVQESEDQSNRSGDGIIVRSEFDTGVIVMRTFISDRAAAEQAKDVLANAECQPALTTATVN